jgi:hypothetical protein
MATVLSVGHETGRYISAYTSGKISWPDSVLENLATVSAALPAHVSTGGRAISDVV